MSWKAFVRVLPGVHAMRPVCKRMNQLRTWRARRRRVLRIAELQRSNILIKEIEWLPARRLIDKSSSAIPETIELCSVTKPIRLLRNVLVWPAYGIAATKDGSVIFETAFNDSRLKYCLCYGRLRDHPVIAFDEPVAVLDSGWRNYYHWWIDDLSRLAGLHNSHLAKLDSLVVVTTRTLNDEARETVQALLPANARLCEVSPNYRIRAPLYVSVPSPADSEAAALPRELVHWLTERIYHRFAIDAQAFCDMPSARIYISRECAEKRRVLNEVAVASLLESYGFRKVLMETLSQREQIALMATAEAVVSLHGAGFTNLAFAQRPCQVLELFSGKPYHHYRWLCHTMGHSYRSVVLDATAEKNRDVVIPLERIRTWVESWLV